MSLYLILAFGVASVVAVVSRINVVIAVRDKKTNNRSHLTQVGKQIRAVLEGCFPGTRSMTLTVQNDQTASGSIGVSGQALDTCTMNIHVGFSGRSHPATITLCGGGSCPGEGTCHRPCNSGTCGEGVHHESDGVCNDDQSKSGTCSGIGGCQQCSGGVVHITCGWQGYISNCNTSCTQGTAPEFSTSTTNTLLFYVLLPIGLLAVLVGLFFLIRFIRKPRPKSKWKRRTRALFGFLPMFVRRPVEEPVEFGKSPGANSPNHGKLLLPIANNSPASSPRTPASITITTPGRNRTPCASERTGASRLTSGGRSRRPTRKMRGSSRSDLPGSTTPSVRHGSPRPSPQRREHPESRTDKAPSFPRWNETHE